MDGRTWGTTIAGLLIIVGMVAGVLSVVPVLEEPNFFVLIATHERQFIFGAGFQFLMAPAYVGFAICLYPALKVVDEALAMGFVGFRLIAGMFHLVGVTLLPLFLVLDQGAVQAGGPAVVHLEVLGEVLRSGRDLVNHGALILSLCLADLFLFVVLYRSRLIPRWLSGWGLVGIGLAMTASFMVLFRLTQVVTPLYLGMNAPLALQSAVLAAWLIARGFDAGRLDLGLTRRAVA